MEENMMHVDANLDEVNKMMMNIINVVDDDDPFDIYILNEMNTITRYVALFKERKQI
jgi:intracellular sulfur oxidation DsrE/DsrF family protein